MEQTWVWGVGGGGQERLRLEASAEELGDWRLEGGAAKERQKKEEKRKMLVGCNAKTDRGAGEGCL